MDVRIYRCYEPFARLWFRSAPPPPPPFLGILYRTPFLSIQYMLLIAIVLTLLLCQFLGTGRSFPGTISREKTTPRNTNTRSRPQM